MINSKDITSQFLEAPSCCRLDGSICPCMGKVKNRLVHNLNPYRIHKCDNGDLIINSSCGKANAIVELGFPTMDELIRIFNMNETEILKGSKTAIHEAIDQLYGGKKDPYIIVTNTHRDSSKKILEITFQRGIKKVDIEDFLEL